MPTIITIIYATITMVDGQRDIQKVKKNQLLQWSERYLEMVDKPIYAVRKECPNLGESNRMDGSAEIMSKMLH